MNISFKKSKRNKIYEDFVNNPADRAKRRAFCKEFPSSIAEAAIRLHKRLLSYSSVGDYNRDYEQNDNRIEIKKGTSDNDALIFKVRVNGSWRKFFHDITANEELLTKDWEGKFDDIMNILVIDVNNHNYGSMH